MSNNFFNFFLTLNLLAGALRKGHNSFLSYSTLFDFKKHSIINYKMIKIQFRLLLTLLHNLILRKYSVTTVNYDKEFEYLMYMVELCSFEAVEVAEEWISPVVTNRPGAILSKDFIIQQAFSAFIQSPLVLNIGNIRHFDLSRYLMRRRFLLLSTLNTDARIMDNQYYLIANTNSYSVLFFLVKFFATVVNKIKKMDDCLSHHNVLRYRYWFGVRHLFTMRYIRRSFFLRGLLARGLLNICLQKLTKSYRRIVLYNTYCAEFCSNQRFNRSINSASTLFLKRMHEQRLVRSFFKKKRFKKRSKKYVSFKPRRSYKNIRRSHRWYRCRYIRMYLFDIFRKRARVKRNVNVSLAHFFVKPFLSARFDRVWFSSRKFFLQSTPKRFKRHMNYAGSFHIEDRFFAKRTKKNHMKHFYLIFAWIRRNRSYWHDGRWFWTLMRLERYLDKACFTKSDRRFRKHLLRLGFRRKSMKKRRRFSSNIRQKYRYFLQSSTRITSLIYPFMESDPYFFR